MGQPHATTETLGDLLLMRCVRQDEWTQEWVARRKGQRTHLWVQRYTRALLDWSDEAVLGRQIQASLSLRHPNLHTLDALVLDRERAHLSLGYVEARPLSDFLPPQRGPAVEPARALDLARQLARLMRDLRAAKQNIPLNSIARVWLTPSERVLWAEPHMPTSLPQRPMLGRGYVRQDMHWLSPEAARGLPTGEPNDVFVLGALLFRMLGGLHPFAQGSMFETLQRVVARTRADDLPTPDHPIEPASEVLLTRCLEPSPDRRPSLAELLAHLEARLPPTLDQRFATLDERAALSLARAWLYDEADHPRLDELLALRPDLASAPLLSAYVWDHLRDNVLQAISQGRAPAWPAHLLSGRLHQARRAFEDLLRDPRPSTDAKAAAAWMLGDLTARGAEPALLHRLLAPVHEAHPTTNTGPNPLHLPLTTISLEPCDQDWDQLTPAPPIDGHEARHCPTCDKDVAEASSPLDLARLALKACLRVKPWR
jgi:hypothetical protein